MRPSLPYDDVLRQETFFLDLYISAGTRRSHGARLRVPGTSLSGTVLLHAEGRTSSCWSGTPAVRGGSALLAGNQFNGTARLLLTYRYLK